jgi:phosphonopyruvate decarboxylase
MVNVDKIYSTFVENGVDFFTGVPDSLLADICAYITDHASRRKHIIAANEGSAVGIASGYYLASGKLPLVYMQNSGIGNSVNPLLSLADEKVYGLPLLLMIGWRGEPGTKDEPQHKKQGEVTLELLDVLGISYVVLSDDEGTAIGEIKKMIQAAGERNRPHAIVVRKNTFGKYKLQKTTLNTYELSREKAMKIVLDTLQDRDIVVSTTGKLSREIFEYREEKGQGHKKDFLTVGSMGHSSSIALGIALERPDRRVYCLDGDGAFIMHMGAISNIGDLKPDNYRHIIFNNGAHESVGGQPTVGFELDIPAIAKACRYQTFFVASDKDDLLSALEAMNANHGPALLEIRIGIHSREDLGRPTTSPLENKNSFMNFVK